MMLLKKIIVFLLLMLPVLCVELFPFLHREAIIIVFAAGFAGFIAFTVIRRKKTEKIRSGEATGKSELEEAREQVAALSFQIARSQDAIYTVDTQHRIQTWNHGAESLYQFSKQEALGQVSNKLLQTSFTADELNRVLKQLSAQDCWIGELRRKTRTGLSLVVAVSMSTIRNKDGDITGYVSVSRDITEQVRLREQLDYLANLISQSTDAIVSVNPEGQILSWNDGAVALFGYLEKEALGKNIAIVVPPEKKNDELIIIEEIKKGNPVRQYETQRVKKDGTRVFVSLTLSPVKNSEGKITSISGIARNISERKQAEQKIIQSEANLQAIFDNASDGFILTDTNIVIKSFNSKIKKIGLFNLVEEIKNGKKLLDLVEAPGKAAIQELLDTALKGKTIQVDRSYTDKAGHTFWLNLTYTPVKKNGIIQGICITARDVTEKKIAEQQKEFDRNNLHALINNTQDLMWSVSRNFTLITSNHAFDEMTMRMSGQIISKGSNIFAGMFNESQQQRYRQYYERAFAGEAFTETEYTFTSFEYWSENSFYPIYEGNSVVGTACISRNISEQRKAAELLQLSFNEKQALAERMSTTLNTLPANIALLNDKGIIIDINNAWRDFSEENGFQGRHCGIGQNYITIAKNATGCEGADGQTVASGIQSIIENKIGEFVFEYACHSAHAKKWFRMVATPLKDREYQGAVVMHIDISKLKQLELDRLNGKMNEQKKITRVMLQAQEKERNELGRELHDNVCQIMAAIKMKLAFSLSNPSTSFQVVTEAVHYLDEAINETRNLSHRMLMPRFGESSLSEALQSLTNTYNHGQRTVVLKADPEEKTIPAPVKETLYRIAQEQLHNIEKYARASSVIVHVDTHPHLIKMCIEDNGIGFDPKKKRSGVGLTNIKNRTESFNGLAKIISSPGEGCLLMVEIPLLEK